jgi:hypothetical protein
VAVLTTSVFDFDHFDLDRFDRTEKKYLAKYSRTAMKKMYLCSVNEKRQNLRPAWATKIA